MNTNESTPILEQEPQAHFEIVEFNDTQTGQGSGGVLFQQPEGTVLAWGSNKWLDNPARRTANTAIIQTHSGNQYIVGRGLIVNGRTGVAQIIPLGADAIIPNIMFGDQWEIPGVFRTSKVESVMAEYKGGTVTGRKVDQDSPFTMANRILDQKISAAQEEGRY